HGAGFPWSLGVVSRVGRPLSIAWADVEPLWVAGLLLVCILAGGFLLTTPPLGLRGESVEWGLYVLLGTLFPIFVMSLSVTLAWAAAFPFMFWDQFPEWIVSSRYTLVVFSLALALTVITLVGQTKPIPYLTCRLPRSIEFVMCSVLLIVIASVGSRADALSDAA